MFLADRTNGRAYATVLCLSVRPSVCLPSVTLCIVAKRCVLEQKLLLRAVVVMGERENKGIIIHNF